MSLQKFTLSSVTIISLAVNIVLLALILRSSRVHNKQDENSIKSIMVSYIEDNAIIGSADLSGFLMNNKVSLPNDYQLCLLIPPSPCGACVDAIIGEVLPYISENSLGVVFLVPKERERDIIVQTTSFSSVKVQTYQLGNVSENPINSFGSCILFHRTGRVIDDIFITLPWNTKASCTFLSKFASE